MASPDAIGALAAALDQRRSEAIRFYDAAAEHLDDVRGRLKFRFAETPALADSVALAEIAMVDGHVALNAMVEINNDLVMLANASAPVAPVAVRMDEPIDRDGRLGKIRERLAKAAQAASSDLDVLADICLGGPPETTATDVAQLAANIRHEHDQLQALLAEAGEVSSCSGSA